MRDWSDYEITLNLWFIYDDLGMIYRLLAQPYVDSGPDDEKRWRLRAKAEVDFWVARTFDIPAKFHVTVVSNEGASASHERHIPVVSLATYQQVMHPLTLFEDAIREIEEDLPKNCPLGIPQQPVVCITPLLMDDDGTLTPTFSNSRPL